MKKTVLRKREGAEKKMLAAGNARVPNMKKEPVDPMLIAYIIDRL